MNLVDQFPQILSEVIRWAASGENLILREGRKLHPPEITDARLAGVANPDRIRVLVVPRIPRPESKLLLSANDQVRLITEHSAGLTLNYGIYIRQGAENDRRLLLHEFVHVAQYERLGGMESFLRDYLLECLRYGYTYSPLERESDELSREILAGRYSLGPVS